MSIGQDFFLRRRWLIIALVAVFVALQFTPSSIRSWATIGMILVGVIIILATIRRPSTSHQSIDERTVLKNAMVTSGWQDGSSYPLIIFPHSLGDGYLRVPNPMLLTRRTADGNWTLVWAAVRTDWGSETYLGVDLEAPLKGWVTVTPTFHGAQPNLGGDVLLESLDFNRDYEVETSDPRMATMVLEPTTMDRMLRRMRPYIYQAEGGHLWLGVYGTATRDEISNMQQTLTQLQAALVRGGVLEQKSAVA